MAAPKVARFASMAEETALAREAIFRRSFKGLTRTQSNLVRKKLIHNIATRGSYESVIGDLRSMTGMSTYQARTIARTEDHEIRATLREAAFATTDRKGDKKYQWIGPYDHRQTNYCKAIKRRTMNGVTMEELKQIIKEEADPKIYDPTRPFTPHINCRHSFVRKY